MPWSGASFAGRHNHALHGDDASRAASMANAILKRTGSERIAIATANKHFERHDDGGEVGVQLSNQTANPMQQGMIQRYSSYTPEKLQELAGVLAGTPQGQVIQRVLAQKRATPEPVVQQRSGGTTPRRATGGQMPADATLGATGYLHGPTAGRGDAILTTAPAGSHVVPADVISGLGEGNSLAGAAIMQRILATGPGGIPLPRSGIRTSFPRAPGAPHQAKGGAVPQQQHEQTPVALSHGEFVVSPEHVAHWGDGDQAKGHAAFDKFIVEMRKHIIDTMKKLPGPVGMKKKKT